MNNNVFKAIGSVIIGILVALIAYYAINLLFEFLIDLNIRSGADSMVDVFLYFFRMLIQLGLMIGIYLKKEMFNNYFVYGFLVIYVILFTPDVITFIKDLPIIFS